MKSKLIKLSAIIISGVMLTTSFVNTGTAFAAGTHDYSTALKDSIIFFDANKCGPQAGENNVFDWRGACHTTDGSDVGVDLTGGYHDAGDHVKFGLPQGYSAAILGWSLYEFKESFDATGNTTKMLQQLKYFTDYFLKSHPNSTTFYYQVGEGNADHTYWGAPEEQTGQRPSLYKADPSSPASDILSETSAALTLMYLNYKNIDSAYATKCLNAAKELYAMGKANQGVGNGQSFYQATSFGDDLAWAATWLYTATNDSTYITDAEQFITLGNTMNENKMQDKWTMCWDDMYVPAALRLAQITGKQIYKDAIEFNFNYWKTQVTTTPGGLKWLSNWGVLRYAAAESMVMLVYCKQNPDQSLLDLAKKQVDYILGDNPANMSYIIGYGSNWCIHPHHRAANGYTYANGDNAKPAKHLLTGALVGGPDQNDKFLDDANQYQYTEVALDYNAGLVGVLAGAIKFFGGTIVNPPVKKGDLNNDTFIDAIDLALCKNYILTQNGNIDKNNADMNGDGSIDAIDFSLLKKAILG
ncbi:glycoside hydrolase family 9 protein [Ruminiclostridium cellulolyticum]|uniref:Glucanase n=2 Tax=Ruminiclostridium cellulolyticum TaxID=1521 RepID=B8I7V9_RUMCH|nr:glycoside hydrolase family 9 protein [Ruminiclostridium cellulolyticum]ACL75116.1 glycoside hydrolase family 9 [Ruminiclostridium cellulolyticum H10]